jgi:hypothetical protein
VIRVDCIPSLFAKVTKDGMMKGREHFRKQHEML